jgi:hypothetical protein
MDTTLDGVGRISRRGDITMLEYVLEMAETADRHKTNQSVVRFAIVVVIFCFVVDENSKNGMNGIASLSMRLSLMRTKHTNE